MTEHQDALAYAGAQVAAARDDPTARIALIERTYHGPTGRAPRHLPFRRAALSFMHWQARRGVLERARRIASRERLVASRQRPSPAGRLRIGRALRRSVRRAVVAGGTALAGVHRTTDRRQLVPRSQREHRRCVPGKPDARRGGERPRAVLHERRARAGALRAHARCRSASGAGAARSARPPGRRSTARHGRRLPVASPRAPEPLPAGRRTSRATSPTSSVSVGCSTTP